MGEYLGDGVAQDARLPVLFFDFNRESPATVRPVWFYAFNGCGNRYRAKGAVNGETGPVTMLSVGGA